MHSRLAAAAIAALALTACTTVIDGTPVTVRDATGTLVGTSSLGTGIRGDRTCVFAFSVPRVESQSRFFEIEVGRRGAITFERAQLTTPGALVELTLGE